MRTSLAVVLAAGEGKRMKSRLPKVLHPIAGLPMIAHVLKALQTAKVDRIAVVVAPGQDDVAKAVAAVAPQASIHVQKKPLGTADAVKAARSAVEGADDVLVVYGDTPLLTRNAISRLRRKLAQGAAVVVSGMRPEDPARFGRLIMEGRQLVAIREYADASDEERKIGYCNGGIIALAGRTALSILDAIRNKNEKKEFYLTDAVEIANSRGLNVATVEISTNDVLGVDDRTRLAEGERRFQDMRRTEAMAAGATLIAPETVFFSHDTKLGRDVTIEPNVVFGPGVTIGDNVAIRSFSHIEGATVASGAIVGPFARLRPGAKIGANAHIGNFVEVKAADVGEGAKINHLTYIGDAKIGAKTNVGAGTITCNYDGVNKHLTDIGAGAFIGSNAALVAPVKIGDGAYVASGSVITDEVPADALAFGRARQVNKPGRAPKVKK
jgi:bifunctional UDP-N-acetylglucosamine pyrophosphorylase / glucosamine-1-phosphate N-acetyltransferase